MTKLEFNETLRKQLSGLPENDIKNFTEYYNEMIDERIDDGMSEQEAVEAMGSVEKIVSDILVDTSLSKLVKEKVKPKRSLKVWEIISLIIGSPLWMPILLICLVFILTIYAVLWVIVITFYAVTLSFAVCAPAGIALMILFAIKGNIITGVCFAGIGIACAGLAMLMFMLSNLVAKGVIMICKNVSISIKISLLGKGKNK